MAGSHIPQERSVVFNDSSGIASIRWNGRRLRPLDPQRSNVVIVMSPIVAQDLLRRGMLTDPATRLDADPHAPMQEFNFFLADPEVRIRKVLSHLAQQGRITADQSIDAMNALGLMRDKAQAGVPSQLSL